MNDRDDTLSIPEYWEKHKFDIANMRHWACQKYGCPEKRDNCECSCKLWEERYQRGNTLKTYSKYVANLTPFLTSSISEVTLFEIRDALICVKKSRKGGKPYSHSTMKVHFSCLCDIFLYAKKHGHADNILAVFASPKKMDPLTMRIYELVDPQNPQNSTLQALEELHERVSNRPRSLTAWQKEKLIQKLCDDIPRDGRSLGIAIFCYAGLRPAECRKLLWRDLIPFVDHPDRAFLNVFEIRGADGNIKEKTKTKNGHRKVPVHCELQKLLTMRLELVRTERPDDYLDLPICCMGNRFWQPCKDYQLASYGDDLFSYIKVSVRDLACYSLDANIERLKNKRDAIYEGEALCLYVLRKNFWTWAEAETQLTDHEKRYVMGHEISDENGRDVRPRLNDENLLWEICQKMDRCVFCLDLHRSLLERELHVKESISFSNCGTVTFNISPEVLKAGGEIVIHCKAEEVNDPIIYETPKAVTPLKKMTAEVSPFPVFPHNRTGINCQYENVLAHEKPAPPSSEEEDDDYSLQNQ